MEKLFAPLFIMAVIVFVFFIQETSDVTASDLKITDTSNINNKKMVFFNFMRPIINDENNKVLKIRSQLINAKEQGNDKRFVARIAKSYSTKWDSKNENWEQLLERVDAIAPELALAQSANESAWGQSRFAKQGNNFFGQWCYTKGCGLVPAQRRRGASHEVAEFDSVNASVRSYIKNINTTRAYALLRKIRSQNRTADKAANAIEQAGGLIHYSERGEDYVREIRSLIRVNKKLMTTQ